MICIDFGSKTTKAALCRSGNPSQSDSVAVTHFNTCAYVDASGFHLCSGAAGKNLNMENIVCCSNDFKEYLGSDRPIVFVEHNDRFQSFSARKIASEFLRSIRKFYERQKCSLGDLQSLAITIPQTFSPAQKNDLETAAKRAGFERVLIFTEPEAIAACFKKNSNDKSRNVLVADWGDRALRLSLLHKNAHGRYVSTSVHRSFQSCGGMVFRDMLAKHFIDEAFICDADICADPQLCIRIGHAVESAQESMATTGDAVALQVEGKSVRHLCSLSVGMYQNILCKYIDAGRKCMGEFKNAIPEDQKPGCIVLSGGIFQHELAKNAMNALWGRSTIWESRHPLDDAVYGTVFLSHEDDDGRTC